MDVEAIVDDRRKLRQKCVVIHWLRARYVYLELGGLRTRILDRQGAEPQGTHDVGQVRDHLLWRLHRIEHCAEIPLRFLAEVRMVLIRHGVKQSGDPTLVVIEAKVGSSDDRGGSAKCLKD